MATAHEPSPTGANVSPGQGRVPFWLWLTLPIVVLGVTGSVIGIVLDDRIYGDETADWAAQAIGQDIANLVAFPALLLLAIAAGRGSVRAYLGWTGILVYSAYTYVIYSFDVHFGPLFLVWVVVLGLSVYALIGGLSSIDPVRVRSKFTDRAPVRTTSVVLITIGSVFYLLWLSEIVPPILSGTVPEALAEAGLVTNPVHVLDLAVFLPAVVLAGVLLVRRRAWGYVLAPALLVAMASLAVGIVSLMAVAAARGLGWAPGVGLAIGLLAVVEVLVAVRLLGALEPSAELKDVLRAPRGSA